MTLSIIIPTLGRSTLVSVLKALTESEDFETINPEILVVHNGKNFFPPKNFPQVKFFNAGTEKSVSLARNLGIQKSIGEVLVFLGDDTIPEKTWLQRVHSWHATNPEPYKALLGKVAWTKELEKDPFHKWLLGHGQFDFSSLEKGKKSTWRHFYTSNISFKKSLLHISNSNKIELFSQKFKKWGFEDAELGYRLEKKGMKIFYSPDLVVRHDHRQTLENFLQNTKKARHNAQIFESLHPEISILPKGLKKYCLQFTIWSLLILSFISQINWWRKWKKAWLGMDF